MGVTNPDTVRSTPRTRRLPSGIQSSDCGVWGWEEGACLRRVEPPVSVNLRGAPPSLPVAAIPRAALPPPLSGTLGAEDQPSSDRPGEFGSSNSCVPPPVEETTSGDFVDFVDVDEAAQVVSGYAKGRSWGRTLAAPYSLTLTLPVAFGGGHKAVPTIVFHPPTTQKNLLVEPFLNLRTA